MGGKIIAPVYGHGDGVEGDVEGGWPVGGHHAVLVVITLELQFQVGSGMDG